MNKNAKFYEFVIFIENPYKEITMTNKEVVTGFFMEGYVRHNYDFLMEHMAPDYLDHSPCAARTNAQCVAVLKNTEKNFSDMQVEISDLIEEDNKVAIRARFTAIHSGEVFGIPATGKRVSFEALEIFRMEDGKIVESWGCWPDQQIEEQLLTEE